MGPDELLSVVLQQVELVRVNGLSLLDLTDGAIASEIKNREGKQISKEEEAKLWERVLTKHEVEEKKRRALLEVVNENIAEYIENEAGRISLSRTHDSRHESFSNSSSVETAVPREDGESMYTIARKRVPRDIARSLRGEITWRRSAFAKAQAATEVFHQQLARTFPGVQVCPSELKDKTTSRGQDSTDMAVDFHSQKNYNQGSDSHQVLFRSLNDTLSSLVGLDFVKAEHSPFDADLSEFSTLRKLTCGWTNGLSCCFEFVCPVLPNIETVTDRIIVDDSKSLSLRGLRLAWFEVTSGINLSESTSSLVRELTSSGQQRYARIAAAHGESVAVHHILNWLCGEFSAAPSAAVKSDFLSPLHLELEFQEKVEDI